MTDTDTQPHPQTASTPYLQVGDEAGLRALVHRFYELMDTLPEAYAIRKLHPTDLSGSEEKLFMFLSGWLGGPPLFSEKFGHPRLRARHLPFTIGSEESAQWMLCMRQAMSELVDNEGLRTALDKALTDLALHMRNTDDA
jgi:hemoglobin